MKETHRETIILERESTLPHVCFLLGSQRVITGQPVNSGQGLVKVGQIDYLALYLAGGSSTRILNMSNILYVNINVFWYVGMYVYEDLNIYY